MKMPKILPIFIFFIFTNLLYAEMKLGIVDADKIRKESTASKIAIEKLNSKAEAFNKNAIKLQKEFSKKYEDLGKKKNVLSADEYNKRESLVDKEAKKVEKTLYNQRANLDKVSGEINEILGKKTTEIIEKIAKEKNINIVFSKSITLYHNASIDITDEVIIELNRQLISIDVD